MIEMMSGQTVSAEELVAVDGSTIRVPDPERVVHLQFRRYAGCPVCNLHLRSLAARHEELVGAGIVEIAVFHSSDDRLRTYGPQLPFALVADPERRLYARFGVDRHLTGRDALRPRSWRAAGRALSQAPTLRGAAGFGEDRMGLPAEFVIAPDGMLIAAKYGDYVDDHWSVDELLERVGR